jgi:DNA-binding NarL/FixJ family response regulator
VTVRVLVADDHALFRSGLRALLDTQPDLECVGEAADGHDAVAQVRRLRPDVAVIDVRMPRLDGITATAAVLADPACTTRVLVLTTYDHDEHVRHVLKAGASGFLLKSLPPEEILTAVRVAARGGAVIDPSVTRRLASRFADGMVGSCPPELDRLTPRERQVLVLVAQARSNAEIAVQLRIGEETVKTHVSRLLVKLELRDRLHAAVWAHRHGLGGTPS